MIIWEYLHIMTAIVLTTNNAMYKRTFTCKIIVLTTIHTRNQEVIWHTTGPTPTINFIQEDWWTLCVNNPDDVEDDAAMFNEHMKL